MSHLIVFSLTLSAVVAISVIALREKQQIPGYSAKDQARMDKLRERNIAMKDWIVTAILIFAGAAWLASCFWTGIEKQSEIEFSYSEGQR